MIDLSKPQKTALSELFGTTCESMWTDELNDFNERKDITSIDREVRRLVANSREATYERWHGMHPDPQVFDTSLGKICGVPMEMLPTIITVMFENMCFIYPSLIGDIIYILNENEYKHVDMCRTCNHFKDDGCYLKGYKQAKKPQDFCSSHSSCTHGSDNQPAF